MSVKSNTLWLCLTFSILVSCDQTPRRPSKIEALDPLEATTTPLPDQMAEQAVAPPEKCPMLQKLSLPRGLKIWSCYRNIARFIEQAPATNSNDVNLSDQKKYIRYATWKIDRISAVDFMHELDTAADLSNKMNKDLAAEVASLGISDAIKFIARGQRLADGKSTGNINLINQPGRTLCQAAMPDHWPNPFTVCRLIQGNRMVQLQIPSTLLSKIHIFLDRARKISNIVEDSE